MKNPFYIVNKHPDRIGLMLIALGELVDGLVSTLSLSFVGSNFMMWAMVRSINRVHKIKKS